jgi:pimeloyl-ACP methyl ester carboxylesterase
VIRGESDLWLDGDVAGRLAASMPNGQLVRLPGVARLVPEEVPDQLIGLLLDFLEGRLHAETRSMA